MPGVAAPAERLQSAAERSRHFRRQKCLHVGKASLGGGLTRGFMRGLQPLPALTRRAVSGIGQQVRFRREPQKDGQARMIILFDDGAHQKQRIGKIRKRIAETLRGMHGAQGGQIGVGIFAHEHGRSLHHHMALASRPNPLPPCWADAVPLPEDAESAGPLDPPPVTAIGGEPNVTEGEGCDPRYWL